MIKRFFQFSTPLSKHINLIRAQGLIFWQARSQQERLMLVFSFIFIAFVLIYFLLWEPAVTQTLKLKKNLPSLYTSVAKIKALAQEAETLKSQIPQKIARGVALKKILTETLNDHHLAATQLITTGDSVQIRFKDIPFSQWLEWLTFVRTTTKAKVTEASISAQAETNIVNVTVTLTPPIID